MRERTEVCVVEWNVSRDTYLLGIEHGKNSKICDYGYQSKWKHFGWWNNQETHMAENGVIVCEKYTVWAREKHKQPKVWSLR